MNTRFSQSDREETVSVTAAEAGLAEEPAQSRRMRGAEEGASSETAVTPAEPIGATQTATDNSSHS